MDQGVVAIAGFFLNIFDRIDGKVVEPWFLTYVDYQKWQIILQNINFFSIKYIVD